MVIPLAPALAPTAAPVPVAAPDPASTEEFQNRINESAKKWNGNDTSAITDYSSTLEVEKKTLSQIRMTINLASGL